MSGLLSIREYRPGMLRCVQLKRHIQKPLTESDVILDDDMFPGGCPSSAESDICGDVPVRVKPRTSFSRARTAVFEYAVCNDWDWFVTFTPGCELHYNDLDAFMKSVAHWVRNMRRVPGYEAFKYVIVPENFDSSDGWHLHGFISGVPADEIVPFDPSTAQSVKQRIKMEALNADGFYNFPEYAKRFGFTTVRTITDINKDVGYICSYMMKSFSDFVESAGCCLYYSCRGLKRSERVFYGEVDFSDKHDSFRTMLGDLPEVWTDKYRNAYYSCFSFSNEYVTVGHTGFFSVTNDRVDDLYLKFYTPDDEDGFRLFDVLELVELSKKYYHPQSFDNTPSNPPPFAPVQLSFFN